MDLTPYVAALRDDLAAAASVGDEATARAGTSLAAALEPAVRLALMNALSDLAGEVSEALDDRSVDLRLQGREVRVVVTRDPDAPSSEGGFFAGPASSPFVGAGRDGGSDRGPTPPPPFPGRPGGSGPDVGDVSRMTLRIVDQIKGQAERAAAAQGMSLNSWVAQAVQGALRGAGGGGGRSGGWSGWPGGDGQPGGGWPGGGWPGGGWPGGDGGTPDRGPRHGGGSGATDSGATDSGPTDSGATDSGGATGTGSAGPGGQGGRGPDDRPDDGGSVDGWVRG